MPGVNTLLNGSDRLADLFRTGTFTEQHPGPPPTIHVVTTATGPLVVAEPGTLLLAVLGVFGLLGTGFWRRVQGP